MAEGGARPNEGMEAGEGPSGGSEIWQRATKSDIPPGKIVYRDDGKKPAVFPKLNDEGELSLDGRPKRLAKFKAKLVSSEETAGAQNVSIIAKALPPECQEPPKKTEKEETPEHHTRLRASIESMKFPFKFTDQDSDDDDGLAPDIRHQQSEIADDLSGIGYIRGLAFSALHNRDFTTASEYLRRELSASSADPEEERSLYYKYDVVLADLECDLRVMECSQTDRKCKDFEGNLSRVIQDNSVSLVDLVRWIEELRSSDRHYGSIALCRAVILQMPKDDVNDPMHWYFDLSYYIFVEMCLRTVHVLGKEPAYTDAIKFIFDSIEKAIYRMKVTLSGREDPDGSENMKIKIGVCYLALSYLCNCVKLFESAVGCAQDGLQFLSSQCIIRVDLLINQTLSFMARGNIAEAMTRVQRAKTLLGNLKPKRLQLSGIRKNWRTRLVEELESEIKARGREGVKGLFDDEYRFGI